MKKVIYSVVSGCVAALALAFGIILLVQALTPKISVKLESDYDEEAFEMHVAVSVRSECKYDIKKCKIYLISYSQEDEHFFGGGAIYAKSNETVRAILPNFGSGYKDILLPNVSYRIDYIEVDNASDIALSVVIMAVGCAAAVIAVMCIVVLTKEKRQKAKEEKQWWKSHGGLK